ncbi:hypothetical protein [Arenibacter sp. F20364]|uniref:hypothetical protein n=1 Tax=Arenibacter sp. F20364 TaxID=2926415 RepID=UPI001FF56BE1|nr:hypothetical protein [Arenibacter sp. F20364]MCK0190504.1 hypothetical protein [Arenibacter sp. F20364]
MNQPSEFGSIMVQFQIFGIFSGPKYGEPFASFDANPFEIETNSPIRLGKQSGAVSKISKNKGTSVQLSQYANVSLSSITSSTRADKFTALQINTGQLPQGKPLRHRKETINNISTQASEHFNLDYRVNFLNGK